MAKCIICKNKLKKEEIALFRLKRICDRCFYRCRYAQRAKFTPKWFIEVFEK